MELFIFFLFRYKKIKLNLNSIEKYNLVYSSFFLLIYFFNKEKCFLSWFLINKKRIRTNIILHLKFALMVCNFLLGLYTRLRHCVCNCVSSNFEIIFFAKIECGLYFLNRFDVLMSKIIFKKWKNIIGMYFGTKSYLKSNCYHTAKHTLYVNNKALTLEDQHYLFCSFLFFLARVVLAASAKSWMSFAYDNSYIIIIF
jgi:hypothetical protein